MVVFGALLYPYLNKTSGNSHPTQYFGANGSNVTGRYVPVAAILGFSNTTFSTAPFTPNFVLVINHTHTQPNQLKFAL